MLNPKFQITDPKQILKSNIQWPEQVKNLSLNLEFGNWVLFAIWYLVFGACLPS
jgi:hypothetical protein